MVKKKILYLMHADWKWIYQRPHVIAKELEEEYEVTVAYLFNYRQQKGLQQKNPMPRKVVKIYNIPYEGKNIILYYVNKLWLKWYQYKFRKEHYDIVWFTSPVMVRYIDKNCKCRLIYDCMDDEVAMRIDRGITRPIDNLVLQNEYILSKKFLLQKADCVFFSSEYLYQKFCRQCRGKTAIVRNGYQYQEIHAVETGEEREDKKERFHIGYIGTIEKWLDIDLLKESVLDCPEIYYHLIGPDVASIEGNANIILEGVTEHGQLYSKIAGYDCLIMPFKVNDIILAVDPVKLYEYISFGKCIISVYYPEIERFSEFVYFYKTKEDYLKLLKKLVENRFKPKYSQKQQEVFLKRNTWEERLEVIKKAIGCG